MLFKNESIPCSIQETDGSLTLCVEQQEKEEASSFRLLGTNPNVSHEPESAILLQACRGKNAEWLAELYVLKGILPTTQAITACMTDNIACDQFGCMENVEAISLKRSTGDVQTRLPPAPIVAGESHIRRQSPMQIHTFSHENIDHGAASHPTSQASRGPPPARPRPAASNMLGTPWTAPAALTGKQ